MSQTMLLTKRLTAFLSQSTSPQLHTLLLLSPSGKLLSTASPSPASLLRTQATLAIALWAAYNPLPITTPVENAKEQNGEGKTSEDSGNGGRGGDERTSTSTVLTIQLSNGIMSIRALSSGLLFVAIGSSQTQTQPQTNTQIPAPPAQLPIQPAAAQPQTETPPPPQPLTHSSPDSSTPPPSSPPISSPTPLHPSPPTPSPPTQSSNSQLHNGHTIPTTTTVEAPAHAKAESISSERGGQGGGIWSVRRRAEDIGLLLEGRLRGLELSAEAR